MAARIRRKRPVRKSPRKKNRSGFRVGAIAGNLLLEAVALLALVTILLAARPAASDQARLDASQSQHQATSLPAEFQLFVASLFRNDQ